MLKPFRLVCIFLLVLTAINSSNAQVFGGNPSSIKWKQINTDTVRIIFPEGLDSAANRVASVVHELQKNHTATIGNKLNKVNIVLQNQSSVSNAYVALGPYRSEFYLLAPQNSFDLGSLSFADLLSIHEYRHVQQYSNFNVGLSKVALILFGQEARAIANAAAIPDWLFEGDAVFNETLLSTQGRGRIPSFFNGYEALAETNTNYSYMKLRNGSYKNYIPDHYNLGYLLVSYGREKYGAEFWKNVTQDAARFKPLFYPFQGAVKKYSGSSYKQFVANTFDYYQRYWKRSKKLPITYITSAATYPSDYKYPYYDSSGSLIVLKTSYRHIPSFYKINSNGSEEKIAVRDIANDDYFSYNNGKIVFASYKPDVRWGYREFTTIKVLNITDHKTTTVSTKHRYFSPDISHDGKSIVTVEMQTNQQSNVVLLNPKGDAKVIVQGSKGAVYTYPKFSADDNFIFTATRNPNGEMALQKINIATGTITSVLAFANRLIGFPVVRGDTVFYTSSYKGNDDIWAYISSKNANYKVASNSTGFYQGTYNSNKNELVASAFTANGYRLASIPATSFLWQLVNEKENQMPDLYIPQALKEESNKTLQNIPQRSFAVAKYNKAYNLFNFYSWRPSYEDPEFSFTIYGQNILNTFQSEIYYTYNKNERSNRVGYNAIYGGWFVQPTVGISQTFNRNITIIGDTAVNELNANVGLALPLNLTKGKHYRSLTISSSLNTQQVNYKTSGKRFFNQDFNYWQGRVSYSSQIQKAVQQIYPHWAQTVSLQYKSILNKYSANQFLASGAFYLPGVHTNHSLVLSGSYQRRDTLRQYAFSNNFPFSRGYTAVDFPRMWRVSANYHFPISYPDLGFANIVYFSRIRANAFYDYTVGKSLRTGIKTNFNTVGGELYFDTKWWNQQPVTFGIRYSRLLNRDFGALNPNQWEIILPVSLFN